MLKLLKYYSKHKHICLFKSVLSGNIKNILSLCSYQMRMKEVNLNVCDTFKLTELCGVLYADRKRFRLTSTYQLNTLFFELLTNIGVMKEK